MDIKLSLNRVFYIPRGKVAALNLILAVVLICFAFLLHYLPFDLGRLMVNITSPRTSSLILLLATGLNFAVILDGIDCYFISEKQAIGPAIGMTVLATLFYAAAWGVFQIAEGHQTFVLLVPAKWNFNDTINSLAAGALLGCLSSLALTRIKLFKDNEAHDFGPFRKACKEWKKLIEKRRGGDQFSQDDHDQLLRTTRFMLDSLSRQNDHIQPVAEAAINGVKNKLGAFLSWYEDETSFSPANFIEFPRNIDKILGELEQIC